jgi:uncharacterized protein involved in exopolysaccharide biosynthesis
MENQINNNDEISLKEIVLKVKEYVQEIKNNWLKIILFTIPFIAYFGYISKTTPAVYFASTKFFLEGDGGNSGLGGLLGQIGLKTGSGKNNPYQILEVANSKLLLSEVLFSKMESDNDFVANHIIDVYGLDEKWAENNPDYVDFKFSEIDLEKMTNLERSALLLVNYFVINGNKQYNALRSISFDDEKAYYEIYTSTINEELSYVLNNATYQKLKYYFEEKTVKKHKETRDLLKIKVDSLNQLVTNKMYQLGRFGDSFRGLVSLEKETQREILQREITGLSMAQVEAYKTYELADYNYRSQQSQFMLIDKPIRPIMPIGQSLEINLLKGIIISLLLSFSFIILRKIYKDAMHD